DGASAGARTVRLLNAGFPRQFFDSSALGLSGKEPLHEGARAAEATKEGAPIGGALRPEEEIFRLGAVVYRCLTGKDPPPGGESGRGPVLVRQAAPEVPALLADLIDRLIDPVPANRPRSAAAVAKSLRVFLKTEEEEKQSRGEEKLI